LIHTLPAFRQTVFNPCRKIKMFNDLKHSLLNILVATGFLLCSYQSVAVTVLVETTLGNFQMELFEDEAPVTVENFISYINDNSYNSSFIHRKASGFVIQGGQYTYINNILGEVADKAAIVNEYGRSNTRGTIAMAKLSNNPDSATNAWFINIADNSSLDTQNGGFTVFGQVTGNGMDVVDAIHALQSYNAGGDFTEIPLRDYAGTGNILSENLIFTDFSIPLDLNEISDLQVTKSVNIQNPALGNSVEFQVTVANAGPETASGIVVTDLIPAGMEIPGAMAPFVSHGTYNELTGIWQIGALASGNNAVLTLPAAPLQYSDPECFVNGATITQHAGYDPVKPNNSSIATVYVGGVTGCADLELKVRPAVYSASACYTSPDDFLDYYVEVHNAGPDTASNVRVSLSGSLGGTSQAAQNEALVFSEIQAGGTARGKLSWPLACARSELVAAYTLSAVSETLTSTDSNMGVTGEFTVSAATADEIPETPVVESGSGGMCFIATAAFGSYMDPHVQKLREFRDNVLLKTGFGRTFVSIYYEYSPPVAEVIAGNRFLRILTRVILTPVVYTVAYPFVALLIVLSLALTICMRHKILTRQ